MTQDNTHDHHDVVFEEDPDPRLRKNEEEEGALYLNLEGFEGPIDLLLSLAQDQKLDLTQISILKLVDQYVAYIEEAKRLELVVAADYLVMAAWLTFLKSKLLLPQEEEEGEPSGADLADALTFQLKRLESMRACAEKLFELPRKNVDFYGRGNPEGLLISRRSVFETELYPLLSAYGDIHRRKEFSSYAPEAYRLISTEEILERFETMLGKISRKTWVKLLDLLPLEDDVRDSLYNRSHLASTFIASLEIAKRGEIALRQDKAFDDIYLQRKEGNLET